MKINRFNENLLISNDKVIEIINFLDDFIQTDKDSVDTLFDMLGELEIYKSNSSKANTQIDDSIVLLKTIKSKKDDIITNMDIIINNLKDYIDSGEKFLY